MLYTNFIFNLTHKQSKKDLPDLLLGAAASGHWRQQDTSGRADVVYYIIIVSRKDIFSCMFHFRNNVQGNEMDL